MVVTEVAAAVCLTIGVAGFALTSLGLLAARDAFDQIHYLAPSSLLGSVAICAAVLLHEGWSQASAKAIVITLLLLISNPVLSHVTARAAKIRRDGQLTLKADEKIPVVEEES